MAVELKAITQKTIGFGFSVSIERELRTETSAKYPDKTVVKASLSGHSETYEEASSMLGEATKAVKEKIEQLEKGEKTESKSS